MKLFKNFKERIENVKRSVVASLVKLYKEKRNYSYRQVVQTIALYMYMFLLSFIINVALIVALIILII